MGFEALFIKIHRTLNLYWDTKTSVWFWNYTLISCWWAWKLKFFLETVLCWFVVGGWRWKFQITEDNQFRKMYWQPNGRVKENKRVQCKIRSKRNCCLIRSTNTLTNIRHSINCCFNWNDMVARIVSIYTTLKFFPLSFFHFSNNFPVCCM